MTRNFQFLCLFDFFLDVFYLAKGYYLTVELIYQRCLLVYYCADPLQSIPCFPIDFSLL